MNTPFFALVPVLLHWVMHVVLPTGRHRAECNAVVALLTLIVLMHSCSRVKVSADEVDTACTRFLALAKEAFGEDWFIPKCHYLLHFAKWLRKIGWIPNCIAMERKHKLVMQFADAMCDSRAV